MKDFPEDRQGTHRTDVQVAAERIAGVNRKEQDLTVIHFFDDRAVLNVGGTTGEFGNRISRP